jgi:hypothetical protein
MSITFACDCGRTINAPDTAAGKRARCPGCGDLVKVPIADDQDAVAMAMADASQSPPLAPAASGPARSHYVPPEPWYYSFLAFVAWIWTVLGVGQFLLVLFVFVGGGTVGVGPQRGDIAMALAPLLMISGGAMIGMLLSAGLVLLAVDAARNLRALRWKT